MNAYLAVIIGSLAGSWLLGVLSNILGARHMPPNPPPEFADAFDAQTYAKSREYARASMRLSAVTDTCDTLAIIAFILAGGFDRLDTAIRALDLPPLATGLAFIGALTLAASLLGLPFEAYRTFVHESRFGFNTTTVRTFVLDRLKSLVLTVILGGPLIALVLLFFEHAGPLAWLLCWAVAVLFSLGLTYIAPTWILPIFNTFTPLEDGELRRALETCARQAGFELSGIFVIDGSRRSTKGNAYFTGLGRRRRIALYDTLIKEQSVEEIVAVLAHEIGHARKGHIKQRLAMGVAQTGAVFFLMSLFMSSPGLFAAFGMERISVYAGLVFFVLLFTPVSLVLSVAANAISRAHEYEADAFAARATGNPGAMISALKKLSASSLTNLTPHPLEVWLHYGHPPALDRIRALSAFSS
ncbi:MAG: M48 family metallopeptidase [Pseudodesulfovibrio sp.]|uniref:Ste24 endopeptidase n=1 Tax=Pseudodesulfovibrio aespoeensis (strain ATCC 700646 / DSM 10631 / Aspo-2) TaxID=643562 RepID=E6VSK7_PSEA9|nr:MULTISPECIES: M48 family metallopeptidase [Pseudodesulfovibrio]MBU4191375.1 M48 family metallopeptidase [Pseudomonadota bacterium]MCG2733528.1 M48 family metallopeptidase [Pseudodesulfovibrio aespoeensis]ADU61992.1 Ste24 endopeptidase [Pseudodesulfovibrio aespoeensis Aspo-2]MBU4476322.1 M48 family metallopeptidase [Pseudomonadota bacterium]MBU4516037.1 M48 family metallopeptidase [Pseudomonadota bacterium]